MSLRRAFRIAGAQTVLASHWQVNDKASSFKTLKGEARPRASSLAIPP